MEGELLSGSSFFCIALTIGAYYTGFRGQRKWKKAVFNPILIGAALVMLTLWILENPVEQYQHDCKPLDIPDDTSHHLPVYRILRAAAEAQTPRAGGTLTSLLSVWLLSKIFAFSDVLRTSLLPKSITSAIGVVLSEQAGGIGALTTAVIIITGVFGNIIGPRLVKVFRLEDPISQGVGFGTASHVVGTSRAMELSPLIGAVSSMSLTLAGLITSVIFSFVFL